MAPKRSSPFRFVDFDTRVLFAMNVGDMKPRECYFWVNAPEESKSVGKLSIRSQANNLFLAQGGVKRLSAKIGRHELDRLIAVRKRDLDDTYT